MFYGYDYPINYASNTGFDEHETDLMYVFVLAHHSAQARGASASRHLIDETWIPKHLNICVQSIAYLFILDVALLCMFF